MPEQEGAGGVDHHGPDRERIGAPDADMVDHQRAEDGASPAGDARRAGPVRGWGSGAHAGTMLRPNVWPATTSSKPADDGGRQVGHAGRRCRRPWPAAWPRRPAWSRWSTRRGSRRPAVAGAGAPGPDVLGERDHETDGQGSGQVDQQGHPGKAAGGDGVVGLEEIAADGAGGAARRRPPAMSPPTARGEGASARRAGRPRRVGVRAPVAVCGSSSMAGPPVPPLRSHQPCRCRRFRAGAPRRDPSPDVSQES